jgi:hypothetical protein
MILADLMEETCDEIRAINANLDAAIAAVRGRRHPREANAAWQERPAPFRDYYGRHLPPWAIAYGVAAGGHNPSGTG